MNQVKYEGVVFLRTDGDFTPLGLEWSINSKIEFPEKVLVTKEHDKGEVVGFAENFKKIDNICVCDITLDKTYPLYKPEAMASSMPEVEDGTIKAARIAGICITKSDQKDPRINYLT